MRDLLLWRALGGQDPLAEELVLLLEELVTRPRLARMPFAGRLISATHDERPRVRAAALAGLSNCEGIEALRSIVRGLDDPDPAVASVAVESLRAVGGSDPWRLVHALFHSDPVIRRAVVSGPLPLVVKSLLPHLLSDEAIVQDVMPVVGELKALPGFAFPALLDRAAAGQIATSVAADLVQRIEPADLISRIAAGGYADAASATEGGGPWLDDRVGELLGSLGREKSRPAAPFIPKTDRLSELVAILRSISADPVVVGSEVDTILDMLIRPLHGAHEKIRRGVALAAAARLLVAPADEMTFVRVLVAAWPAAAIWRWLDVRARRSAVEDFFLIPADRLSEQPVVAGADTWLTAIIESDLIRDDPHATIDVRALAGAARLIGHDALDWVVDRFGIAELVAGLLEPRAGPFLTLPGSPALRFEMVAKARGTRRRLWPRRLAHLVLAFNRELLPLLADFTPAETLELLSRMQRLDPHPEIGDPRGRRLQGVAAELGWLLTGASRPESSDGVRSIGCGPRPGEFVFEAGPHVPSGPLAEDGSSSEVGGSLGEFVRQWREGPRRARLDLFLREVFLAALESLPAEPAPRWLTTLDADSLRFLLFEQFADNTIPSRLDALLQAALADRARPPAQALATTLASAGRIIGGLNRVWAALMGHRVDAAEATPSGAPSVAPAVTPPTSMIHTLTVLERCRLIDVPTPQLARCLRPWVNRSTLGLAACLARRAEPHRRSVDAAAAILMCHDPLPTIDRALRDFLPIVPSAMGERLDSELSARRPGGERLTLHLHAWLWRWERHLEQGLAILVDTDQSLATVVAATAELSCLPLAVRLLEFVRAVLERCGFRDRATFQVHATEALASATVAALAGPAGVAAAQVLVAWSNRDPGSVILGAARLQVISMLPDLPRAIRVALEPWVSSRGLDEEMTATVAVNRSLRDEFEDCLDGGASAAGQDVERAIECVLAETHSFWFMPEDWDRLVAAGIAERSLAHRLVVARQPHAYVIAVETLLTEPEPDATDLDAIAAFLEQGDTRLDALRLLAAKLLQEHGVSVGFPLLLADETRANPRVPSLFVGLDVETVVDAVRSALATEDVRESVLADLLMHSGVSPEARAAGLQALLMEGTSNVVRDRILPYLARSESANERVRQVASSFAWGIRRGLELTGRLFTVTMIAGDGLGYTRLHEPRVFVSPLPVLRGERSGGDVVRGLVIHEIGHHLYHADAESREAATAASDQGLFKLLNLVLDEHLERNLRAIDPAMGDPLKRLAAYAFQHAPRELAVQTVLESLDDQSFAVLSSMRLSVARRPGHVVLQAGGAMRHLERRGGSFPRFVRALRMGLGARDADPRTRRALALFGPAFRHSSARRLLEIARELRSIFGEEVRLLDLLGDLGTPVSCEAGDAIRAGEGVTDRELQEEVERVLNPPPKSGRGGGRSASGRGRLTINVSPDEDFATISVIEPVSFDAANSADYRRRVARPAANLRRFFGRLGFRHRHDRQRLQGRLLDRGRLLALAVRGEPRVMVSRRLVPSTDLFLGVAVDCSGSMRDGDNIEKARLFAELLAESVRGNSGVTLRVCGFNDATIFDAGSADRCAAHNLQSGGGNNDAAGLLHLAGEALGSRRTAKLLVMISDGLPTQCSTAALRRLVGELSRRHGICCAQVAVRPLEEECFPIHILLDAAELNVAVALFGRTIIRLVQRVVGTGG